MYQSLTYLHNSEAILESRSLRMELCIEENGNILTKIDQLKKLPDTGWATTEQVAEFYEVQESAIKMLISRHKDEFTRCGYKILQKNDLTQSQYVTESSYFGTRNYRIAIFPRTAILLCGCLLRDSIVAQAVRAYLITLEKSLAPFMEHVLSRLESLEKKVEKLNGLDVRLATVESIVGRLPFLYKRLADMEERVHLPLVVMANTELENYLCQAEKRLESFSNQIKDIITSQKFLEKRQDGQGEKLEEQYDWLMSLESHLNDVENFFNLMEVKQLIARMKEESSKKVESSQISRIQIALLQEKMKEKEHPRRLWRRFNRHFSLSHYYELPASKFEEALLWLDCQ